MQANLKKLFEPGKIGSLELKNRIIMPAMCPHWAGEDGNVTPKHVNYYAERARGGVGMVITEACCVQTPVGRTSGAISLDDDKYFLGLSKLAKAIKKNGARACCQLYHAGAAAKLVSTGGLTPVAPSTVDRRSYEQNRALTTAEIKEIRDCFIQAAMRCCKAGFDAVEVHGAHHYLLAQFLSPAWNKRDDEYGGNIENRARLFTEIVSGIKRKIDGLPVICRINGNEYGTEDFFNTPGLMLADARKIAGLLEASGADAIDVSAWGWGRYGLKNVPQFDGDLLPLAEAIKKVVSIPLIAVGRMTPDLGEQALYYNKTDFIAMGRAILADPYLPQKLCAGDLEDIAPCITCYECLGLPRRHVCSVNARLGEEGKYPYPIKKAVKSKKVVIIGAGPGGMEASRVAALRGHDVTLYEKQKETGGKLLVADKAPGKENIGLLSKYLRRQVEKLGVKLELGKVATIQNVLSHNPDVVIVATGGQPVTPKIKGLTKSSVVEALNFLTGRTKVGNKVVIIGGEMVGCEVAEILTESRKKDVSITTLLPGLATGIPSPALRYHLITELRAKGVKFYTRVTYKEATGKSLVIRDKNGNEQVLEADSIVMAAGTKPDNRLLRELNGKVAEIICIGDAVKGRKIIDAINEGFKAAFSL
ncbi:FAD-dependent oxidoreductase [Chloroflexota bacterium]